MTLAAVEALVRDRIGLDPASLGPTALARVVGGRMHARGLTDAQTYARLLTTDPTEWAALVGELAVPETWFFRGGLAFFDHLARWVRDRASRPSAPPVRALCVPCSTGEEPYSLALALDSAGVPPALYRIDGVDLDRGHLRRAAAARYPAFSFRESGSDPRPRYFQEAEAGKWDLRPHVRERVRFHLDNLVDPAFLAGEPPYDLILCRNLFIYLTAEGRARALANLDRLLAPDGRLCLTPAEADRLPPERFVPDGVTGFSIYRRAEQTSTLAPDRIDSSPPPSWERSANGKNPSPGPSPEKGGGKDKSQPPAPPSFSGKGVGGLGSSRAQPPEDPAHRARDLANAGQLDAARSVCEAAIAAAPSGDLFSLLGVIHLAAGRREEATAAFRRALYLDPDNAEALTHMIVLCEQHGDTGQARALRRRLERGAPA